MIAIDEEDAESVLARALLQRYYAELDGRFPGGFDVARAA